MNATTTTQRSSDDFYSILAFAAAAIVLLSAWVPAMMPAAPAPVAGPAWTAPTEATATVVIAAADADQVGASIANFDR